MIRRKAWLVGTLQIETTTQRCIAQGEAAAPSSVWRNRAREMEWTTALFSCAQKGNHLPFLVVTQRAFRADLSQGEVDCPAPRGECAHRPINTHTTR